MPMMHSNLNNELNHYTQYNIKHRSTAKPGLEKQVF